MMRTVPISGQAFMARIRFILRVKTHLISKMSLDSYVRVILSDETLQLCQKLSFKDNNEMISALLVTWHSRNTYSGPRKSD